SRADRSIRVHRLRRDDAEVTRGQLARVASRAHSSHDVPGAAEPQAVAVDRVNVLAREVVAPDLDLVELSEVRGKQRADRPAPDHADPHAEYDASRALIRW